MRHCSGARRVQCRGGVVVVCSSPLVWHRWGGGDWSDACLLGELCWDDAGGERRFTAEERNFPTAGLKSSFARHELKKVSLAGGHCRVHCANRSAKEVRVEGSAVPNPSTAHLMQHSAWASPQVWARPSLKAKARCSTSCLWGSVRLAASRGSSACPAASSKHRVQSLRPKRQVWARWWWREAARCTTSSKSSCSTFEDVASTWPPQLASLVSLVSLLLHNRRVKKFSIFKVEKIM